MSTSTAGTGPDAGPSEGTGAEAGAEVFVDRLFGSLISTLELACVHVGDRLGLYRGLDVLGDATSDELARATSTDERYVREWLEQQAAAGVLGVDDPAAAPRERRFAIPAAHREPLVERDSLLYGASFARIGMGVLAPLDRLIEAFRTGEGIPYTEYGPDTREGIADFNGPMFVNLLGTEWLPAIADVDARLRGDPPARVADIACGLGASALAIARAYPRARIDGLDSDAASIEAAREAAERAGLADRVRFLAADAGDPGLVGPYDLVTIFEALHDMARPVEALAAARGLLAEDGCVIVADERVAERFAPPADEVERLNYGFSVLHCLAVGREDADSAATGTVMRPDTVRGYAAAAGFADVEVLPIENDFWRFYRLSG